MTFLVFLKILFAFELKKAVRRPNRRAPVDREAPGGREPAVQEGPGGVHADENTNSVPSGITERGQVQLLGQAYRVQGPHAEALVERAEKSDAQGRGD